MIKIKGLEEGDIINIINKVAKNHSAKAFSYYTEEDIEQEVWIITLKALKGFKPKRAKADGVGQALENWLNIVVSRRLKNFYRDNYVVPQKRLNSDKSEFTSQKRKFLMHPISLGEADENNFLGAKSELIIEDNKFLELLVKELDFFLYDTLETILSGESINCYYKNKLYQIIKKVWATYESGIKADS